MKSTSPEASGPPAPPAQNTPASPSPAAATSPTRIPTALRTSSDSSSDWSESSSESLFRFSKSPTPTTTNAPTATALLSGAQNVTTDATQGTQNATTQTSGLVGPHAGTALRIDSNSTSTCAANVSSSCSVSSVNATPSANASSTRVIAPSASRTLAANSKSPSSWHLMAVGASRLQPLVGGRSRRLSTRSNSVACSPGAARTLATFSSTPAPLSAAAATNANTWTRNSETPMATATTLIATPSRTLHSTASKLSVRSTPSTTSSSDSHAALIFVMRNCGYPVHAEPVPLPAGALQLPLSAVLAAASQVMGDTVHSLATPDNVHANSAADLSLGGLYIAITSSSGPLVAWTCSSPADRFRLELASLVYEFATQQCGVSSGVRRSFVDVYSDVELFSEHLRLFEKLFSSIRDESHDSIGALWDRVQHLEVCEKVRLAQKLRSLPQLLAVERLRGCERGAFLGEACRLLSDQMGALQRQSEELLRRVSDRALSCRSASDTMHVQKHIAAQLHVHLLFERNERDEEDLVFCSRIVQCARRSMAVWHRDLFGAQTAARDALLHPSRVAALRARADEAARLERPLAALLPLATGFQFGGLSPTLCATGSSNSIESAAGAAQSLSAEEPAASTGVPLVRVVITEAEDKDVQTANERSASGLIVRQTPSSPESSASGVQAVRAALSASNAPTTTVATSSESTSDAARSPMSVARNSPESGSALGATVSRAAPRRTAAARRPLPLYRLGDDVISKQLAITAAKTYTAEPPAAENSPNETDGKTATESATASIQLNERTHQQQQTAAQNGKQSISADAVGTSESAHSVSAQSSVASSQVTGQTSTLLSPTCVGSLSAVAEQSPAEVASDPIRMRALARLSAAFADNARDLAELVDDVEQMGDLRGSSSQYSRSSVGVLVDSIHVQVRRLQTDLRLLYPHESFDEEETKKESAKSQENKPKVAPSKALPQLAPTDSFEALLYSSLLYERERCSYRLRRIARRCNSQLTDELKTLDDLLKFADRVLSVPPSSAAERADVEKRLEAAAQRSPKTTNKKPAKATKSNKSFTDLLYSLIK